MDNMEKMDGTDAREPVISGASEKTFTAEELAVLFDRHVETIRRWNRMGALVAEEETGDDGAYVYSADAVRKCADTLDKWTPELIHALAMDPASIAAPEKDRQPPSALVAAAGAAAVGVGLGVGMIGLGIAGFKRLQKYLCERRDKLQQEVQCQPDRETLLQQRAKLLEELERTERLLELQKELEETEALLADLRCEE